MKADAIPPHNLDAERAVLGAVLLEGREALPHVILRPTDFYTEAHRSIFTAMLTLTERREPVDLLTVSEELRRADALEFSGGPAALALLVEQASIGSHLVAYARLVRDAALHRETIQAATQIATLAFDAKDEPEVLIDDALERFRGLKGRLLESDTAGLAPRSLASVLERVVGDLQDGPPPGVVRTPFPSVNQFLAGGFHSGEFVLLGGYAGFGKTAMALEITTATAARGDAVLVISREMLVEALGRRLLSQQSGVDASSLRSGHLDAQEWDYIREALPKLHALPVWMTDRAVSIAQIEAMVRLERERHDLKLLVVDYLQLVRGPRSVTDKRLEVEHVSGALKALAQEHRIVVLAISAMSRRERGAPSRRPTIADLRETGQLEHDADIILLGHRPDMAKQETELIIAKGRGNRTGIVELLFFGNRLTFEEKSIHEEVPF